MRSRTPVSEEPQQSAEIAIPPSVETMMLDYEIASVQIHATAVIGKLVKFDTLLRSKHEQNSRARNRNRLLLYIMSFVLCIVIVLAFSTLCLDA